MLNNLKKLIMVKKSEYSWVWGFLIWFVLAKVFYEVLGVWFAVLEGESRAIIAAIASFYFYTKIGDKIERLI